MKLPGRLIAGVVVILLLAGCASAPVGPFQYSPDEKKIQGYQTAGKALRVNSNNMEITVEPLTIVGLARVLNPGEQIKEVGVTNKNLEKIKQTVVFYITFDNKGKRQVLFNSTRGSLVYTRKNWYKINTEETLSPLDYAEFYTRLSRVEGAGERMEVIRSNIFHGTTVISPGEKKSGLIFFSWKEKDEDVTNIQLNLSGIFVGIELLNFSFNFKVVPVAAASSPPTKP